MVSPQTARPDTVSTPSTIDRASDTSRRTRHEPRNLLALAVHLVLFRIGWIFKIESILMPAFLDHLAGPGWVRGMLPVLNRLGQSITPLWASDMVRAAPRKNCLLMHGTWLRGALALLLAGIYSLSGQGRSRWMAGVFLCVYTLFFMCHGVSQLAFNTLQGKVLRPTRFGRLMALSDPAGTVVATVIAFLLLPIWLGGRGGFTAVFLCTGISFALSLLPLLHIREDEEDSRRSTSIKASLLGPLRDATAVWRLDRNFRFLAGVVMLYSTMQILVPHYQAYGREVLGLQLVELTPCVVAQNLATGLFSLLAGPAADRWGSRIVMRWLNLAAAMAPLWALAIAQAIGPAMGRTWFFSLFIPVGLMPVCYKTFNNYVLEATAPELHARYLSTLSVFVGAPFLLAPLVGWATEGAGFEPVFLGGAGLILVSGLLAGRLEEPRRRRSYLHSALVPLPRDER